ncbi:MAG: hypothetical protein JST00_20645 [Deltaproteobacteria bacterium]|nr:hypothetical protein [Deltaproteobacteria bacterium]
MSLATFLRRLLSDTRGEDLTEKSSALSNAAKVGITAAVIAGAASGATVLANNANKASDTTSSRINTTVGAQADRAEAVQSPFK